jgi:hypothetical protein
MNSAYNFNMHIQGNCSYRSLCHVPMSGLYIQVWSLLCSHEWSLYTGLPFVIFPWVAFIYRFALCHVHMSGLYIQVCPLSCSHEWPLYTGLTFVMLPWVVFIYRFDCTLHGKDNQRVESSNKDSMLSSFASFF